MSGKTDFSEEEWTRLKRSPFVAGMAISLSDPGGPIELVKETAATLRTVTGPAAQGDRGELVTAVAEEVAAEAKARKNPLSDFRAKGALALAPRLEIFSGGAPEAGRPRRPPRTQRLARGDAICRRKRGKRPSVERSFA
jgi:hypothetical protein